MNRTGLTVALTQKYTFTFVCMATPCQVILYSATKSQANKVASAIEKNSRRLELKYNFFDPRSFLSTLNHRADKHRIGKAPAVFELDDETTNILHKVKQLSLDTLGHFDISVGTIKHCSNLATATAIDTCRHDLKQFAGPDSWRITDHTIEFSNAWVKLDLGGVIKEYAVDQAGVIARNANMPALINFGGDIYVNGLKPDGSQFAVAIKNPKQPAENIAVIELTNQALTTSAHYERSEVIDGDLYSHIIGQPTSTAHTILSATVISDCVLTSGIYSTALLLDPSLELAANVGVLLIDQQLRAHQNIF